MLNFYRKIKVKDRREIQIFNITVLQYNTKNLIKTMKFFSKSIQDYELDRIIEQIPNLHDGIFWFNAGLGETNLFVYICEQMIKKYKIKNPCFISHRKVFKDLLYLYFPNIPFYQITRTEDFLALKKTNFKYKKRFFHINPCTPFEMMSLWEKYRKQKEEKKYVKKMLEFSGINDFRRKTISLENVKIESINKKTYGILQEKFFFIINEANFFSQLSREFWSELEKSLNDIGYKVIFNSSDFNISEAYYIASRSQGIISLRCGFLEILSTLQIPKFVLYTQCKRNLDNILDIFTLTNYPYINKENIYEYNTKYNDIDKIKTDIINKIIQNSNNRID